ncbi:MAG: hypothetical protein LBN93_01480 [Candidatus Symbiothrix sp.]|jgi:hypothetical protein|nr:hypothetical protein [Candidatus Symbiothrix sp.]
MKKIILFINVFLVLGVILSSCNNESSVVEPIVDNSALKVDIKDKTIAMYNSRGSNSLRSGSNFSLTAAEKRQLAQTSLNLLKSYGLTEAEINVELGGITDDKLIETAFSIIDVEEQADKGIELIDSQDNCSLLTGELVLERPVLRSQVFDCAMQVLGVHAVYELITGGINRIMTKAAVKTLIRKVAMKYMGVVGYALAVYEFGDCMDWW